MKNWGNHVLTRFKYLKSINGLITIILFILIALVSIFLFNSAFIRKNTIDDSVVQKYFALSDNTTYEQSISGFDNHLLSSFDMKFNTSYKDINSGITLSLTDGDKVIQTWTLNVMDIHTQTYTTFKLTTPVENSGHLSISLTPHNINDGSIEVYSVGSNFVINSNWIDTNARSSFYPVYISMMVLLFILFVCFSDISKMSWIKLVAMGVVAIILICSFDYIIIKSTLTTTSTKTPVENTNDQHKDKTIVLPGDTHTDIIKSVSFSSICFYSTDANINDADFSITITNSEGISETYTSDYMEITECEDGDYICSIDDINSFNNSRFGDYYISITNNSSHDLHFEADKSFIRFDMKRTTYTGIIYAYIIAFILCAFVIVFCGTEIYKKNPETIFLCVSVPFILIFGLLNAPWNTPDSHRHFEAAYRFSSRILGQSEATEWSGRAEDVNYYENLWRQYLNFHNSDIMSYSVVSSDTNLLSSDNTLIEFQEPDLDMKYYSIVSYLPIVIGISLGRILGLGFILTISLGRIFTAVMYVFCIYRAIKKVPYGKYIFLFIALFPISLILASAISYDSMVLISTISFIATFMAVMSKPNDRKELIEMVVWSFLLGGVKGGGYLILLPLTFTLYDRNHKEQSLKKIIYAITSGLLSFVLFYSLLQIGNSSLFQLGYKGDSLLSISFLFEHPLRFLLMTIKSYFTYADQVIFGIPGRALGWIEKVLPIYITGGMLLIMFFSGWLDNTKPQLTKSFRFSSILVTAICLISVPAMLLSFTPANFTTINGIQGRYFIPVLPLIVLVITNKKNEIISDDKSRILNHKCIQLFMVLLGLSVLYMMQLYFER